MELLDRVFRLESRRTTVGRELLGGVTTFMALSYIVFVQPAVMAAAGVPEGGALVATCVASAIACLLMAFTANYPIALAPAMGHNFFFSFTVCLAVAKGGMGYSWQQALAAVFIGGAVFVVLSFFGFRAWLMELIPDNMKRAIAAGIGLMIALLGLEYAGILAPQPEGTYVAFGKLGNPYTLLAVFGLAVTLSLLALKVRGAVLFGILLTATVGCIVRSGGSPLLDYTNLKSFGTLRPGETLLKLDFGGLFAHPWKQFATVILIFLFLDVFDTVGTLVGVSERAGLLEDGRLPRARWALFSDAVGTVVGAVAGTSTVTSYVESATSIQAGARTGLANVATAACFLVAILAYPLLGIVSKAIEVPAIIVVESGTQTATVVMKLYPVIAPALIVVGGMMLVSVAKMDWDDPTELFPAFLTIIIIPLTVNITEGIAFGFIAYSLLKIITGRWRDAHWGFHLISLVLLLRYVFLPH